MSAGKRLKIYLKSLPGKCLPDNTPPRLLLFFIITVIFSLTSILAGLFIDGSAGMHNAAVAVCFFVLYLITFAMIFLMARPGTDGKLERYRRKLLVWSKIIAVTLLIAFIVLAVVLIPWLFNNDMLLFGKIQIPPVTSDHIALTYQANQALLDGKNPYTNTNIITAMKDFPDINPTCLRQGDFADVYPYPSDEQIEEALAKARANPDMLPLEFESKLNYPAGAFLLRTPFDAIGMDPQIFYMLCILAMSVFIAWKAPPRLRSVAVIGCAASLLIWLSHFFGATESIYILFILLGWTLRKRPWLAAIMMGIACTSKQTAWFFIPFYLVLLLREIGWRKTMINVAIIGIVFALTNLPFIIADPQAWASGVLAPIIEPLYPSGIGIAAFATLSDTPAPQIVFTVLEIAALIGTLWWYYLNCRKAPQTGLLLAIVPLFLAWRSQFAYFIMIPLLVFGAVIIEEYKNRGSSSKPSPVPDSPQAKG